MSGNAAGIDVGADKKGCNLVVLRGTTVLSSIAGIRPEDVIKHCVEHDVVAVGVDAPCIWRIEDRARLAEREMACSGISYFSTPSRQNACANTSGFYDWMFCGERVYQALAPLYPLLQTAGYSSGKCSFETFPHAITVAMLGQGIASAKEKASQRRRVLEAAGIDTTTLTSMDALDAGLCALTASYLLEGRCHAFGDESDGFIYTPLQMTAGMGTG